MIETHEVPVFKSDRTVWVAQYEGFPNTQGVADKKEDAIAQLEQLRSEQPGQFAESERIPGF